MRALSEIMVDASARAFQNNADPSTGTPWQPLSAARQKQREGKGRSVVNMLQDSGLLVGSIANTGGRYAVREIGPGYALVGTNVPYAAIHQFGGKTGRASSGRKKARRSRSRDRIPAIREPSGIGYSRPPVPGRRPDGHPGHARHHHPEPAKSPQAVKAVFRAVFISR